MDVIKLELKTLREKVALQRVENTKLARRVEQRNRHRASRFTCCISMFLLTLAIIWLNCYVSNWIPNSTGLCTDLNRLLANHNTPITMAKNFRTTVNNLFVEIIRRELRMVNRGITFVSNFFGGFLYPATHSIE